MFFGQFSRRICSQEAIRALGSHWQFGAPERGPIWNGPHGAGGTVPACGYPGGRSVFQAEPGSCAFSGGEALQEFGLQGALCASASGERSSGLKSLEKSSLHLWIFKVPDALSVAVNIACSELWSMNSIHRPPSAWLVIPVKHSMPALFISLFVP